MRPLPRWLGPALLLAGWLAGCSPDLGAACEDDTQCPNGTRCVLALGVCARQALDGESPAEDGAPPALLDQGSPVSDGGPVEIDGPPVGPTEDAAGPGLDARTAPPDARVPPLDGGGALDRGPPPDRDALPAIPDAFPGNPDLGPTRPDTTPPLHDGGSPLFDATPSRLDEGPPVFDATPPPGDRGSPVFDATPPPNDTTPPVTDVDPPPTDVNPPVTDVEPPPTDVDPPCERVPEICDGVDNNCDDQVDEPGPDLCGPAPANGAFSCKEGRCRISCVEGAFDLDEDPATGCERRCTVGAPFDVRVQGLGLGPDLALGVAAERAAAAWTEQAGSELWLGQEDAQPRRISPVPDFDASPTYETSAVARLGNQWVVVARTVVESRVLGGGAGRDVIGLPRAVPILRVFFVSDRIDAVPFIDLPDSDFAGAPAAVAVTTRSGPAVAIVAHAEPLLRNVPRGVAAWLVRGLNEVVDRVDLISQPVSGDPDARPAVALDAVGRLLVVARTGESEVQPFPVPDALRAALWVPGPDAPRTDNLALADPFSGPLTGAAGRGGFLIAGRRRDFADTISLVRVTVDGAGAPVLDADIGFVATAGPPSLPTLASIPFGVILGYSVAQVQARTWAVPLSDEGTARSAALPFPGGPNAPQASALVFAGQDATVTAAYFAAEPGGQLLRSVRLIRLSCE